jgi:hypothetical protein
MHLRSSNLACTRMINAINPVDSTKKKCQKTYSSQYPLVVTHPTTNLSRVFFSLWPYVERLCIIKSITCWFTPKITGVDIILAPHLL